MPSNRHKMCWRNKWIHNLCEISVINSIIFKTFRSIWTLQQEKKLWGIWKSVTWPVSTRLRVRFSRWWKRTRTGAFWSPNCSLTCLSHAGMRNTAVWRGKGRLLRLTTVSCLIVPKSKTEIFLRLRVWGSDHLYKEGKRVKGEGLCHWSKHNWSNTRNSK